MLCLALASVEVSAVGSACCLYRLVSCETGSSPPICVVLA
jgi:hypothetical protein